MIKISTAHEVVKRVCIWIAVTGVSLYIGLVLGTFIASASAAYVSAAGGYFIGALVGGALIGLAQWTFLRPPVKGLGIWLLATIIGWTAGLVLTAGAMAISDLTIGRLSAGMLGGGVIGLTQWLAFQPEESLRNEWALTAAGCWTVTIVLGMVQGPRGNGIAETISNIALSGAVGLVILGTVAIAVLVFLFPEQKEKKI